MKYLYLSMIILLFLSGCSYKNIKTYQDGDELLSCTKLTTKISDIININNEINKKTGLETNSIVTWVIWPPAGGINQIYASDARDDLDDRFIRLMNLKYDNNCIITEKERNFINDKGRFSDIIKN